MGGPCVICSKAPAAAADFNAESLHTKLVDAFNNRQWEDVKSLLAEDSVFHRANAGQVYSGPDAIADHFEQTIGGEWNVTVAELDSESAFTGNDGRVVERGDFAMIAGGRRQQLLSRLLYDDLGSPGRLAALVAVLARSRDRARELQVARPSEP